MLLLRGPLPQHTYFLSMCKHYLYAHFVATDRGIGGVGGIVVHAYRHRAERISDLLHHMIL